MARPLRLQYEGATYHITARGNRKRTIFECDSDRQMFLSTLEAVTEEFKWLCHAYCLMENHYHLVVETRLPNLSSAMRQMNGVYAQSFNNIHKRAGHLFEGRFKAIIVEREPYLLELIRYVVLNPVRAGLVQHPIQWRWSSYSVAVGEGKPPSFLTTDFVLALFSDDKREARRRYVEFIDEGNSWDLSSNLRSGILLGSEEFAEKLEPKIKVKRVEKYIPKTERFASRKSLAEIFSEPTMGRVELEQKIRKAYSQQGYTLREIADHLGVHNSVVSWIAGADGGNFRNNETGLHGEYDLTPIGEDRK